MIDNIPIGSVTIENLISLIENKVAETTSLEYKALLKIEMPKEKKEFLFDVSSFANTNGGLIIYGIPEVEGIPASVSGIDLHDAGVDALIKKITSILDSGIVPKIQGYQIRMIEIEQNKQVVLIKIPRSLTSPHRVIYDKSNLFYGRKNSSKYPMNVYDLRVAFNQSSAFEEKVESYKLDRIAKIIADSGYAQLGDSPKLILHVIPLTAFEVSHNVSVTHLENDRDLDPIYPYVINVRRRINLRGILFKAYAGKRNLAYTQLHRNGIIEVVDTKILYVDSGVKKEFDASPIVEHLGKSLERYLKILDDLSIPLPFYLSVTLIGLAGCQILFSQSQGFSTTAPIEEDILFLDDIIIENRSEAIGKMLKPIFNQLWNASGYDKCPYVD